MHSSSETIPPILCILVKRARHHLRPRQRTRCAGSRFRDTVLGSLHDHNFNQNEKKKKNENPARLGFLQLRRRAARYRYFFGFQHVPLPFPPPCTLAAACSLSVSGHQLPIVHSVGLAGRRPPVSHLNPGPCSAVVWYSVSTGHFLTALNPFAPFCMYELLCCFISATSFPCLLRLFILNLHIFYPFTRQIHRIILVFSICRMDTQSSMLRLAMLSNGVAATCRSPCPP